MVLPTREIPTKKGKAMYTICIDGKSNGNLYFGLAHALPVARRIATSRKRKGDTACITVLDTQTGEHTEV